MLIFVPVNELNLLDMGKIKCVIRKKESDEKQTIYVSSRFGRNDKLMYATPLKVEAIFWDESKGRVKNSKYCTYKDELNQALIELEAAVSRFIIQSAADHEEPGKARLARFLDSYFGHGEEKPKDFHSFFEQFLKENETRMNDKTGKVISYKNQREYINTYRLLCQYESKKHIRFDWEDIDVSFYNGFITYLQSLNYATNTIGHKIVALKAVLNAAKERKINDCSNYSGHLFHTVSEESQTVYLDEKELDFLYNLDLSKDERLDRTRDLFLVGCWTGLRFSDVTRIRPEYIQNDILTIVQQKTGGRVAIPLHPVVKSILEKYKGNLPECVSNQKFNEALKDLGKYADLNERVFKSITKGGHKETTVYKKWELISSHTARRSFATNLYKSGFPSISIMQITGHKTEKAFMKYIKVTTEEHAKLLQLHWAKSGSLLKVVK